MSSVLSRGVFAMSLGNAVALAATIASYFLYSRLLTPAEFGIYASALAIAKFGTILLDGGLKTALIKHAVVVGSQVHRALFLGSALAALALLVILWGVVGALAGAGVVAAATGWLFAFYAAAYFLTYPLLIVPLAELERAQRYTPVARAEALGITIEYGLPALLWLLIAPGFWTFLVAVWIARLVRTSLVLVAVPARPWLHPGSRPDWPGMKELFLEGLGLQLAVSLSMVRDNLHLLLVGPWFGKEWVGLYAWALQLCAAASQVFALSVARLSLPALRLTAGVADRWQVALTQIAWLTLLTAPPLVFLTPAAAAINATLFGSKWSAALPLLPFLVARMLPGMATTPLGYLVMAERNARAYALANAVWTGAELLAALVLLALLGPRGLAWSYSFMAWVGLLALLAKLPGPASLLQLLGVLLGRPSLWLAMLLCGFYVGTGAQMQFHDNLPATVAFVAGASLLCVLAERRFRDWLAASLRSSWRRT